MFVMPSVAAVFPGAITPGPIEALLPPVRPRPESRFPGAITPGPIEAVPTRIGVPAMYTFPGAITPGPIEAVKLMSWLLPLKFLSGSDHSRPH